MRLLVADVLLRAGVLNYYINVNAIVNTNKKSKFVGNTKFY